MSKLIRNSATIALIDILTSDERIWKGLRAHGFWTVRDLAMQVYLLMDRKLMTTEEILTVNFKQVADHVNGTAPDAGHIETRFLVPEAAQIGQSAPLSPRQYNMQARETKMYLHDTLIGEAGRRFCETTLKLDPAEYDISAVHRVEVYGTDIDDPGEDYCEFRVIDCEEKTVAIRSESGY